MKKLLIMSIFTLGSLSTAFAGGQNCSKQNSNSAAQAKAKRYAASTVRSSKTRPASGKTGKNVN